VKRRISIYKKQWDGLMSFRCLLAKLQVGGVL
jgi:hypothetical protein